MRGQFGRVVAGEAGMEHDPTALHFGSAGQGRWNPLKFNGLAV
jgi:hypothetical protein